MGCGCYMAWLSARLDGELTAREARELEAHLAQCPACRALASQLAAIQDSLEELEEIPAPEGFAQRVMERVRAQEEPEKKKISLFRRPRARALAGLAACLVLCVGVYQAGVLGGGEDAASYATAYAAGGMETAGSTPEEGDSGMEAVERTMEAPREESGTVDGDTPMLSAYSAVPENLGEEPQSDGVEVKAPYQVGGQAVSAVLTLSQLPQGWEEALGAEVEWLTDEGGQAFCLVAAERMEAVCDLAQGQDGVTASVTSAPVESGALCAVVIAAGL